METKERVRKQFVRLKESGKKVYVKRFKEKLFIAEKEAIVDCERKIKYAGGFIGSYGELELTFSTTKVGRFSNLCFSATKPTRHRRRSFTWS
jgi:hypothetical protein